MCKNKNCGCNDPCKPVICVSYQEDSCEDRKLTTSNTTHPTGYDNVSIITPEVNQISAYTEHLEFVNSPEPLSGIKGHSVLRLSSKILSSLFNIFKGRSVGTGAKVYKGATTVGADMFQDFKSIKNSNSIDISESADEITPSVNTAWLQSQMPTIPTVDYPVIDGKSVGTSSGIDLYKGLDTDKKIKIARLKTDTITIANNPDGSVQIDYSPPSFGYIKSFYVNSGYSPTVSSPSDGSIIRPYVNFGEAINAFIGNGNIVTPQYAGAKIILQTSSYTSINPTINNLTIEFQNGSILNYTGSDVYMFDSEVLVNSSFMPKTILNEIDKSIYIGLIGNGGLRRSTPGGFIRVIGAKRGSSTTTGSQNSNNIYISIGDTDNDSFSIAEFDNYPSSVWGGDVMKPNGNKRGDDYSPPLNLKWSTVLNPTNPLIYVEGISFPSQTFPFTVRGFFDIYTLCNTAISIKNTKSFFFGKVRIQPQSELIAVNSGVLGVPNFQEVYKPKDFPAILLDNSYIFNQTTFFHENGGTFEFHGYKSFLKLKGDSNFLGNFTYDTNYYFETFIDATEQTQSYCTINKGNIKGLISHNIQYLINPPTTVGSTYNLIVNNINIRGNVNNNQNTSINVIPQTGGSWSSIKGVPYTSGILSFNDDTSASTAGILPNGLYINNTTQTLTTL